MNSINIKDHLLAKGIRPSVHRLVILEYLMSRRNHPTADMIYKDISKDIPTLSKTTIYNTLRTFHEKGVVQSLTIDENEVRFDATLSPHAHFKCISCGMVTDVSAEIPVIQNNIIDGNRIVETQVYYRGLCCNCLKSD